ncbi:MAG: hypothetical protein CMH48_11950 [Muricauda sp.]|nr:hypothetical protein [Allomuricauda sp.]MBC31545.1 hypothetical protein [Allomuricauda sp.]|tara:strand:- start:8416 stop:9756 length:1341 start_codon:yes stop_codon:yes gene_type:complete
MLPLNRFFFLFIMICTVSTGQAQLSPEALEAKAERNVEKFLLSNDDGAINAFINRNMAQMSGESRKKTFEYLKRLRSQLRPYLDGIGVDLMNNIVLFNLSSDNGSKQLKVVLDHENDVISDLEVMKAADAMTITLENLGQTIDNLEQEGFAGLVHVRIKGEVFFEKGFGMANEKLNQKNTVNTIFGIGSRPIDFTVAAIFLLRQKGQLALEDTIDKYLDNVPEDKSSITIHHLLTGQSGFPDFFHTNEDWDADLRYIDRKEAVQRLLAQELLFEPGKGKKHSHGAFGLLAALIEIISGEPYYTFIRQNFLDPANMTRTGEYGESRGLTLTDFAVGHGPSSIGIPNIPPNWGKTSWLVKGSGGMYSTLNDLLGFYRLIRSGDVLNEENSLFFKGPTANMDGSDRGFELFNVYFPSDTEVFLFLNRQPDRDRARNVIKALEDLAKQHR